MATKQVHLVAIDSSVQGILRAAARRTIRAAARSASLHHLSRRYLAARPGSPEQDAAAKELLAAFLDAPARRGAWGTGR